MQQHHLDEDGAAAKRLAADQAIRAYALAVAGTDQDLDPLFEAAGVEFWLTSNHCEGEPSPAEPQTT